MKGISNKKNEKSIGFKDQPIYDENPFIIDVMGEIKVKHKNQFMSPVPYNKNKTEVLMVNSDSGEIEGHTAFMRHHEVDQDKFTKLYINQLAVLWDLNKTSIRVFTYILSCLKPMQDYVLFDYNDCMKFCGYKTNGSVYDGLFNLIKTGIIAKSKKSYVLFINPTVVFNGNRITFINTYTKKKKQERFNNPNQVSMVENKDFDSEPGITPNKDFE